MAGGSSFIAVVLAEPVQGREARVAGLPAISRILIEAARAGAEAAFVVPVGQENLTKQVRDDVERAVGGLRIHWLDRGAIESALSRHVPTDLLVLSREAIVGAQTLRRLSAFEGSAVIHHEGQAVAVRAPDISAGLGTLETLAATVDQARASAAPGDVIRLCDVGAATREILRRTGKGTDGVVSRWLNRPLSRLVSRMMLQLPSVRPAQMTLVTLAIALAMFACLMFGGRAGLVAGGILFQLASVIDGVDGEIARATFRTSRTGAIMDTAVDMATNLMFVLGLTISLGQSMGPIYWQVGATGFLAFLLGVTVVSSLARRDRSGAGFDILKVLYASRYASGPLAAVASTLRSVMSRDFFAFAFALLTVCGQSWIIPWAFAIAASLWLLAIALAAPAVLRAPQHVAAAAGSSPKRAAGHRAVDKAAAAQAS